jgi:hypothetical protein
MAFELTLPEPWAGRGWKAKIRDKERLEPPHVTLLHKTRAWRIGLRGLRFLDESPAPKEVPGEVFDFVGSHLSALKEAWDRMYPENPVEPEDDDA